jgi:hypothetical protein
MPFAAINGLPWPGPGTSAPSPSDRERRQRILSALGSPRGRHLRVDPQSLARYYDYLVAHLELPFAACYPRPWCRAEFDGLYCRTRKGKFIVNLPLVELTVLLPSKNVELLADYEYWFWHWRE